MARDRSVDVARGALMLYIVAIIHGVWWFNIFGWQRWGGALLFEMPAIFIVSGYAYRLFEGGRGGGVRSPGDYVRYLVTRLSRILVPYWAYALAAVLIVQWLKGSWGHSDWKFADAALAWADPTSAGSAWTGLYLNNHLWFLSPFIVVTALLPVARRLVPAGGWPLWSFAPVLAAVMAVVARLPVPRVHFVQMVVFYLAWALFGYGLAGRGERRRYDARVALIAALVGLGVVHAIVGLPSMQEAKFPPTWIFTLFSMAWMAALLLLVTSVPRSWVDRLGEAQWFAPFVDCGYSVYLWQGVAYSVGRVMNTQLGAPIPLVWAVTVVLSAVLGRLASPLERIRIRL